MDFSGINYVAVIVAWIINCAVGAYWYSPAGFAKKWEAYTGIDIMNMPEKEATQTLVWVVVSALIQAIALAVVLHSLEINDVGQALLAGGVLWLGFVAATTVGVTLYSRRSWKYWWLNASYFLIVMLVNSVILAVWR